MGGPALSWWQPQSPRSGPGRDGTPWQPCSSCDRALMPPAPQQTGRKSRKEKEKFGDIHLDISVTNCLLAPINAAWVYAHRSKAIGTARSLSALTQLNSGDNGCKNMESKQESLPVTSLACSPSLWYYVLIFLALVSLETAVQFFWMNCVDVDDPPQYTSDTWREVKGGSLGSGVLSKISFHRNSMDKSCVLWWLSI